MNQSDAGYTEYLATLQASSLAEPRVVFGGPFDAVSVTTLKAPLGGKTATGYPDNNPKTQFGLKKAPLHLVPPSAIRGLAEAFENGAAKYGAFNWREKQISSTVYYAACLRHLTDWYDRVDAGDVAPDSGVHHVKHAMACLAMILDTLDSDKLNDNRPVRCPALDGSKKGE
jgi:hypothetical protein